MNYHTRFIVRLLCVFASLACVAWPVLDREGWAPLWALWPGAMFATAAVFLREDEGDRACREHAEWHYGKKD